MGTKPGKSSGLAVGLAPTQASADVTGPDPQGEERRGCNLHLCLWVHSLPDASSGRPLFEFSHLAVSPRCTEPPSLQTLQ